ncbi:hypothetical protein APHAL10511_008291 [Amanita phalloides]|nr:hypothetical protein APHAL10511_008291 [Amanita phalloides]
MGLFSPRKSEDNFDSHAPHAGGNDNTVVRVIRSRLYGKNKGKGRESPIMSFTSTDSSPSQTLSGPNLHLYSPTLSSPLARSKNQSNAAAGPSSPRSLFSDVSQVTPPRNPKRPHPGSPDMPPPPPKSAAMANRLREREKVDDSPTKSPLLSTPLRKATDSVTMTLAQRLNELAVANSEGLLNGEEYRLLRQNLFERFSSTAVVPAESPVVPVAKPRPRNEDSPSDSRPVTQRLSGHFQVEVPQSPSRTLLSSGVVSIFRRATGRRSTLVSKDLSDGSNFVSEKSSTASVPPTSRVLERKSSISSVNTVNTTASHAPTDSVSISSRRTNIGSDRGHSESVVSFSPTGTRSNAGSIRLLNSPPSSFRASGLENKQLGNYIDDDRLQTSQEIKQEILSVEAEAKNMMDAFNGLELTALTKLQKATGRNSVIAPDTMNSAWTLASDGQSRMNVDNDRLSIMSGISGRTSTSIARSACSARQVRSNKSLGSPVRAGALLHRQDSSSSVNSSGPGGAALNLMANSSNISLTRSITHMRVVPENGVEEEEMEVIRRRREEVMLRYDARLEYLRARLKGAQLHEKLLRKLFPAFAVVLSPFGFPPFASSRLSATAMASPDDDDGRPSHFSVPSSPNTPRQLPPPILLRNPSSRSERRALRSTSTGSSQPVTRGNREDSALSEEDESMDNPGDVGTLRYQARDKIDAVEENEDESEGNDESEDDDDQHDQEAEDEAITVKDRQSLINVEHPFGLPIWKPALYKKSRSVTRYADAELHSVPSAQAERHLLPGNIFWVLVFGWWLALVCITVSAVLYLIPFGGNRYASLVFGLGWYLAWPFGKYVEGDVEEGPKVEDEEDGTQPRRWSETSEGTIRATSAGQPSLAESSNAALQAGASGIVSVPQDARNISWVANTVPGEPIAFVANDHTNLLRPVKSYGTTIPFSSADLSPTIGGKQLPSADFLGKLAFWIALVCIIAPLMLIVCLLCWAFVVTVPMAKLNWALIKYLFQRPSHIRFCAAPPAVVVANPTETPMVVTSEAGSVPPQPISRPQFSIKHPRLSEGQVAPSGHPTSTVLLCTYRAAGWQYYKYTVGGVNIIFVNLLPVVFLVIFDGFVLLRMAEDLEQKGKHVPFFLSVVTSKGLIFVASLLSVIPLSYFIGMAVASISAQSSIGMGAVINATFGSIIEIILYAIALTQGKGRLVEGSIVGSLLAGVLLMPGMSMCSMALRRKESTFNAKSAGVTSMMLIMAVIGALAPTLFYQTYGNFELVCSGCPSKHKSTDAPWVCKHCYYKHPDPIGDPFYQSTVKNLMYFCAVILLFSYLIGLWFSLRTHASQIWQNPQQLLQQSELPVHGRTFVYQKPGLLNAQQQPRGTSLNRRLSMAGNPECAEPSRSPPRSQAGTGRVGPPSPTIARRSVSTSIPVMESVDQAMKQTGIQNLQLGSTLTHEELERVVAAATVSALRHQEVHGHLPPRPRSTSVVPDAGDHLAEHGHPAPSWSRTMSASVLLVCTALYAVIAELLVDVVDFVLKGSGIDEKFLGVTLFALVPNTTEFMNAMSFALHGNIALSMEIGSAYALQVCLLQIPAMVAFSAWYDPKHMGEMVDTFTLIFPKWDVIALILSMFLMTYTYIEAKSNYHRGSILILSYLVLVSGFYFAPPTSFGTDQGHNELLSNVQTIPYTFWDAIKWYLPS